MLKFLSFLLLLLLPLTFGAYCNDSESECQVAETPLPPVESSTSQCSQERRQRYQPEDFAKLKPKIEQLLGSRWAMEVQKSNYVIHVHHSIEVVDTTLINKDELLLRIEFNLRQKWVADKLEFPEGLFKEEDPPSAFVTADASVLDHMWSPDSYISTSRESKMNTNGNPVSLVYIFKNTSIIYKVRMFTKVACSSNFQWYPLDVQNCDLTIESYKYHSNVVLYHWTDEKLYRPVVVNSRRLYQYELRTPVRYSSGLVTRGGRGMNYSYVQVKFRFERKLGNNIIQVYTPTLLVVVLSWFSFWLGLDAVPGRISLLVTCMLTLVTMHSGMKTSIPPVHYVTMMDVWYVCCMASVFSAMCEFVAVKFLHWRHQQRRKAEERVENLETRARLYSIYRHQQRSEEWGGNSPTEKPGMNGTGIGTGIAPLVPILPVDRGTALAASVWMNAMEQQQQHPVLEKLPTGEISQSIMVESGIIQGNGEVKQGHGIDGTAKQIVKEPEQKQKQNDNGGSDVKFVPIWISMDKFSRAFFPSLFGLFNGIYWSVLFLGSGAQNSEVYKLD